MTRFRRPALALGALAISGLLLAGCTAAGGGWTDSSNGAKRATFGFNATDEGSADQTVLRGSWADGSVKFRFVSGFFEDPVTGDCADLEGTYTSTAKPTVGQSGYFYLDVCDEGEPGVDAGDWLDLDLVSGPFSGYSNTGDIRGGNLKINVNNNDGPSL